MPFGIRLGKRSQQYTLSSKELTIVQIELVDHTKVIECTINALTAGKECLQNVCQRLHIQDDHQFLKYFGLVFLTKKRRFQWIDMSQPVKKQLDKYSDTIRLYIRIQIHIPDVSMIYDDATRSFYYCQLKAHVLDGRLVRFDRDELVLLAAYALQVEFGDFDPDRHTKEFLANNALIPRYLLGTSAPFTSSKEIADSLFESLAVAYRNLQGTSPNEAKVIFISSVQSLELLGQEGFPAKDASDGSEANLGVYLKGIFAVKENGISQFPWSDIINLIYEKRTLIIELGSNSSSSIGEKQEYILHDLDFTRYAWEVCVAQHQLYTNGSSFNYNFSVPFLKPSDASESDGHSQKDIAINHTIASTSNASMHQSPITSPQSPSTTVFLPTSSSSRLATNINPIEESFKSSNYLNQSNLETPIIDLNCQSSPHVGSMSHFNSNSVHSICSMNGATGTSATASATSVANVHQVDSVSSLRDHGHPSWQNLIDSSRNNLSNLQTHITDSSLLNINDSNDSISSNVINNNHIYGHSSLNNPFNSVNKHISNNNIVNNGSSQTDEIYGNSQKSQLSLLSSLLASSHLDANSNLTNNHIEYSDYVNGAAIDFAVKKLTESQETCELANSSPPSGQCHSEQQQRSQLLNQFNSPASDIIQNKLTSVDPVPLLTATDAANMLIRKSTNDSDPIYANANACKSLSALASQSELLSDLLGHSSNTNINFLSSLTSTSPSIPSSNDSYDKRPLSYNERLAHLPPYKEPPSYDEYVQKKYGIDGVMLPYDIATVGTSIAPHHIDPSFHHDQCGILMGDKMTGPAECSSNIFDANDTDIKSELNAHCKGRQSMSKMNRFTSQSVGSLSTKLPDDLDYGKNEFNAHLMKAYLLQQKLGYNASSDAFHLYQNLNYKPEDLINVSVTDASGYTYCDESIYSTVKPKNRSNIASSSSSSTTVTGAVGGKSHLGMASHHHGDTNNCIGDYTQRSLTLNESNNPYSVKGCTTVPISLSMDEIGPVTGGINTRKELCDVYKSNCNNQNNEYICTNSLLKEQTSAGISMGGAIELPGCDSSSSGYLDSKKKIHELNLKVKLSTGTGMTGSTVSSASTFTTAATAAAGATATATMRTTASTSSSSAAAAAGVGASASASSTAASAGVPAALNGPTCTFTSVPAISTGLSGYPFLTYSNANSNSQISKIADNMPTNFTAATCSVSSATLDMKPAATAHSSYSLNTATPSYSECANRINSSSCNAPSIYTTVSSNQNNIRHMNGHRLTGYTSTNGDSAIQLNQLNSSNLQAQPQPQQAHQQAQNPAPLSLPASTSACHLIQNHSACSSLNGSSHNSQLLNQIPPVQPSSFQVSRQLALYYAGNNTGGITGQQQRSHINTNTPSPNSNANIPNYLLAHQQLVQQQRQQYLIRPKGSVNNSFQPGSSTSVNVTGVSYQPSMAAAISSASNQYQNKSGSLQRHIFNNYQQMNQHILNQLPPGHAFQQRTPQLTQISLNANRRNAAPAYSFQSVPDLTQPVQANVVRGQSFSQYAQSKVGPMGSGPQMCFPVECRNHQHSIQSNLQQQRKSLITSSVNALPSIVSGAVSNVGKFIPSQSKSSSGYSVVNKTPANRRIAPPGSGSVPNLPNMMMASEQHQFTSVNQQQQQSEVKEKVTHKSVQGVSNASTCLPSVTSTVNSSEMGQTLDYCAGDVSSEHLNTNSHSETVNCHQHSSLKNVPSHCRGSHQVTSSNSLGNNSITASSFVSSDSLAMHACSSSSAVAGATSSPTTSYLPPATGVNSVALVHSTSNLYNRTASRDNERNTNIVMKEKVDDTCVNNEYNSRAKSDKSPCDTGRLPVTKVNSLSGGGTGSGASGPHVGMNDTTGVHGNTGTSSNSELYLLTPTHITSSKETNFIAALAVSCESSSSSSTVNRGGTSSTFTPTMTTSVVTSGENGKVTYEVLPCTSSSPSLPATSSSFSSCATVSNDLVTSTSTQAPVILSTLGDQQRQTSKVQQQSQCTNVAKSGTVAPLSLENNVNHLTNNENLPLHSKLQKIRNELELQQQQLQERSAALSSQAKNLANSDRKVYDIIVVHTKSHEQSNLNDDVMKLKQQSHQQQSSSSSQSQVIENNFRVNSVDGKSDDTILLSKQNTTMPVSNVPPSHPIPQPRVTTVNKIKDHSHVTGGGSIQRNSGSSNVTMTVENEVATASATKSSRDVSMVHSVDSRVPVHQATASTSNGSIQRANRPKNLYEGTSPVLVTEDESESLSNVYTPTKTRSSDPRIGKIEAHMTSPLFRKEFDSIPRKDSTAVVTTALLPENICRNRFMDILPYEFNRVKIECGKDNRCKYINASHVTINIGTSVHRYIAAQGPLCDTVVEFWHAVWSNKVSVIVMVTELEEGGHEKCFKYFPSEVGSRVTFGTFSIHCKSSEHTLSYVTSVFSVTNTQTNLTRDIWHIRYTDWQDHTCPHVGAFIEFLDHIDALNRTFNRESGGSVRSTGLLQETTSSTSSFNGKSSRLSALFSSLSRSSKSKINHSHTPSSPTSSSSSSNSSIPPSNSAINCNSHSHLQESHSSSTPPLLVHCSAGVGRSGVVILCDALIRSLDSVNGEIDVPQVLTQLRMQRMNSIQNFTQYCFVYRVLSHYLHNSRLI